MNWNGHAVCGGYVAVCYRDCNGNFMPPEAPSAPDGTFAIGRIMPGEPIRLYGPGVGGTNHRAWSETFTLAPGECGKGVVLKAYQPAALRGIVVNAKDAPKRQLVVTYFNGFGGYQQELPDSLGRFGANGLNPGRLCESEASCARVQSLPQPGVFLKAGREMRFVKVVMKRATPKQPTPAGRR